MNKEGQRMGSKGVLKGMCEEGSRMILTVKYAWTGMLQKCRRSLIVYL